MTTVIALEEPEEQENVDVQLRFFLSMKMRKPCKNYIKWWLSVANKCPAGLLSPYKQDGNKIMEMHNYIEHIQNNNRLSKILLYYWKIYIRIT